MQAGECLWTFESVIRFILLIWWSISRINVSFAELNMAGERAHIPIYAVGSRGWWRLSTQCIKFRSLFIPTNMRRLSSQYSRPTRYVPIITRYVLKRNTRSGTRSNTNIYQIAYGSPRLRASIRVPQLSTIWGEPPIACGKCIRLVRLLSAAYVAALFLISGVYAHTWTSP